MNDLWAVGLTGAMVGGALGWPLLRHASGPGDAAPDQPRMLGAMFLLGAAAVTLIATSHGGIAPPPLADLLEHIEYAGDLLFWALLTLWLRRATGLDTSPAVTAAIVAAPLSLYLVAATATHEPPRFIWLLPASVLGTGYAIVRARQSKDDTNAG